MSGTQAVEPGTADGTVGFDDALFCERTDALGHKTMAARARAVGLSRAHLYRLRQGQMTLRHDRALAIAALLDVKVERLFPPRSAA